HQNQSETEQYDQKAEQNSQNALQNEPETKQPEPVVQQEPEKICTACGQTGGGNCPDCGAVMATQHTRKHSMKRIRLKFRKMIRRKWKALNIHTRRMLAALRITPAIVKLARRQIP
ncbi:TPA: exonuclease VIII, partial [Escherichia coli]|nr:exonuclease VIII [Escherichia coli]